MANNARWSLPDGSASRADAMVVTLTGGGVCGFPGFTWAAILMSAGDKTVVYYIISLAAVIDVAYGVGMLTKRKSRYATPVYAFNWALIPPAGVILHNTTIISANNMVLPRWTLLVTPLTLQLRPSPPCRCFVRSVAITGRVRFHHIELPMPFL